MAIKPLMKRLRGAASSPIYSEVKLAYQEKPAGLSRLRDIVRSIGQSIPASS